MFHLKDKRVIFGVLALSLSACGPAPNTQPGVTPTSSPVTTPSSNPSPGTLPASTASLRFRLVADPSLGRFSTAQVNDFSICLAQIARASTRFSFNGPLSAAASAALTAAGAQVETSGDSHTITFSSAATLAQLLSGISLTLPEVPTGAIEGRTTFFDAAGLELGFVTWQATLNGGTQDVTVTLSEADGASNPVSNACPRLKANVNGATLRGAGGQLTSGNGGPSATPTPGTGSGTSSPAPTPTPDSTPGAAPGVPTGLQVVEQGETYLTLQWDFPSDARSFKLYLDGREVAANHVTPNYYRFEGLRASTNYTLGVRSVNAAGESAIVDTRGTTLGEGGRSASGNFSSGGNGNTSSNRGELNAGDIDQVTDSGTMISAFSDVAMDADGNYLITWVTSDTEAGYGIELKGQHFNASGREIGDEIVFTEITNSGIAFFTHVAMDDDGNYVLSWHEYNSGSSVDVYARAYDANDQPVTPVITVNNYTLGSQAFADVAMDDDGNFAVTWAGTGSSGNGVYTRSFDNQGSSLSGDVLVDTVDNGPFLTVPAIAMDGDGDYVVAWSEKYTLVASLSEQGVFYRRFDLDSTPQADKEIVTDASVFSGFSFGSNPVSVDMDQDGSFVVAWPESTQSDGEIETEIKAALFSESDAGGTPFTVAPLDSTIPIGTTAVSLNNDGDFVVNWGDRADDETYYIPYPDTIKGRYYTGSNKPLGKAFTVKPSVDNTSAFQLSPAVALSDDGDFVVTWSGTDDEDAQAFSTFEIYKRDYSR